MQSDEKELLSLCIYVMPAHHENKQRPGLPRPAHQTRRKTAARLQSPGKRPDILDKGGPGG